LFCWPDFLSGKDQAKGLSPPVADDDNVDVLSFSLKQIGLEWNNSTNMISREAGWEVKQIFPLGKSA